MKSTSCSRQPYLLLLAPILIFTLSTCKKLDLERQMAVTTGNLVPKSYTIEVDGYIVDEGNGISEHGHVWGPEAGPDLAEVSQEFFGMSRFGVPQKLEFKTIINLDDYGYFNRTFYVRSYVTNGETISYGLERNFFVFLYLGDMGINQKGDSIEVTSDVLAVGTGITNHGFVYSSLTNEPTLQNNEGIIEGSEINATGSFRFVLREEDNLVPGTTYYIRAFVVVDGEVSYGEVQTFVYEPEFIQVNNPNPSIVWEMGRTYPIEWDDNLPGTIRIQLFKGPDPLYDISPDETGNFYPFTVPMDGIPIGADYRILVSGNGTGTFNSSGFFEISGVASQYLVVTDPVSSTVWAKSGTATILWESNITPAEFDILIQKGNDALVFLANAAGADRSRTILDLSMFEPGEDYRLVVALDDGSIDAWSPRFTIVDAK